MKYSSLQSITTIAALVSLTLLTDPFMALMPTPAQLIALVVVSILLSASVAFIFTEHASDERDELHRMEAGRLGYASGLLVLIVALVVQGYLHSIDPWVVAAIAVMLVVKVGVRIFDSLRK